MLNLKNGIKDIWLYTSKTVKMAWNMSFEKLNPFNKLNSKCQYNSIKTCHSNKNLNTRSTTICKAGAVIEMPFQILSHNKVEKYLNFLSNHITPSLFKHVLFLHFKSQFFTNYIFGKTKDYSFEIQLNFMAGLCRIIFRCPISRLNKCPSYISEFNNYGIILVSSHWQFFDFKHPYITL